MLKHFKHEWSALFAAMKAIGAVRGLFIHKQLPLI